MHLNSSRGRDQALVFEIVGISNDQEDKIMSATTTVPIVKESVGWSIALSVLMIVAGFLAIICRR